MPRNQRHIPLFLMSTFITCSFPTLLYGTSFTIVDGQTVTTPQTLSNDETGTIESGGQLNTIWIDALTAQGDDITVINNGTISADGAWAYGIISTGAAATISNNGTISTAGEGADGISLTGTNATLASNGTINTADYVANGIYSTGTNATLTSNGTISTAGIYSDGIFSTGANAILTSNGTISTAGIYSDGIYSTGANATLASSGTINTAGQNSQGIFSTGDDVTIIHNGTINVSGANTRGIAFTGLRAIVTNSGTIVATGNSTEAIVGSVNDDVLNLKIGSRIIGSIDLDSGNDTVNITGRDIAGTLTLANVETVNIYSGYAVRNGSVVAHIDPTQFSAEATSLAHVNSLVQQALQQQLMYHPGPVQVAAVGDIFLPPRMYGWGKFFDGHVERDQEDDTLGFEHDLQGLVGGYEAFYGAGRIGFVGGITRGDTQVNIGSQRTDTLSLIAGVYGQRSIRSRWMLNDSLMIGKHQHNSRRTVLDNLNGIETASADYYSLHIAYAIAVVGLYKINKQWQLYPRVELGMSWIVLDSYSETGTTRSNMQVDSRRTQQVTLRVGAEMVHPLQNNRGNVAVALGSDYRRDGGHVSITVNGGNLKFSLPGDKSVTNYFLSGRIRYRANEGLALTGDIELGSGNEESWLVSLGMEVGL